MYNNVAQNAKSIVLCLIRELNAQDFVTARKYVDTNIQFHSVLGEQHGANAFFNDIKHSQPEYDIKSIFSEGSDVCLVYNLRTSGIVIFCCGLYHVTNNKIDCLKVVFDPRPLIESTVAH